MSKNTDLSELINYVKGLSSGKLNFPFYTSSSSFTGTVAGYLGFDSSGNVLTTSLTSSQWTTSGSNIYYNTGNVGIGTTSPGYLLTVAASSGISYIGNVATSGNNAILRMFSGSTQADFGVDASGPYIDQLGGIFRFYKTGGEAMRIASGGQVLIGTTAVSALEKFSVSGSASYSGVVRIENNVNPVDVNHGILNLVNTLSYAVGNDASVMFSAKDFGGTVHPRASIGAKTASALGADLVFNTRNDSNYAERLRITSQGNVGIGTTTPTTKLQVIGTTSSTDLYLSGTYTQTIYTNEAWSSWQWAIPSGTLVGGGVYIVTLYFITDNWPWQVSCAFEYCPVNSNGAGADNTFTPLISTHTGGSGIIYARNVAVGGQICGGLQIYFSGFTKNTGTLYVRAIRIG